MTQPSSLRSIARQIDRTNLPPKGKPGGRCPKCEKQPLGLCADLLEYGEIARCVSCGWQSAHVQLWLLLFMDMATTDPQTLGGAVVRGLTVQQATERAVRLNLLPDGASVLPVGATFGHPEHRIDTYLTREQLDALVG